MPVAIGGMHRSGTSMTARLLNVMGTYLGEESDLVPATSENPEGYWEHTAFVDVNDEILHELGGGWDCPVPLPAGAKGRARLAPLQVRARQAIERLDGHEHWGWKDPRNSLTLPFWQELVPKLKVVVCLRHPLEVALSLQRRGMFSYSLSFSLWKTYNERILDATESSDRLVTHYDSYLADGPRELERLADFAELQPGATRMRVARKSIRPGHRHARFNDDDLRDAEVAPAVVDLYMRMQDEAERPREARPARRRRPTTGEWKSKRSHELIAGSEPAAPQPSVDRKVVDNDELRRKLRRLQPMVAQRERTIESLEAQLKDMQATLREAEGKRGLHAEMLEQSDQRQDALMSVVNEIRDQLDRRGNEVQGLLYELHGLQSGVRSPHPPDGKDHAYRQTVDRIRESIHIHVPQDATVLVASRGDENLVKLYGRRAWHFPRLANGTYLGHHPANSEAAIVHLETMRALGATHFVLPEPSRWWLDHYAELSHHLETRCRVVFRNDDICRIYSLIDSPRGAATIETDTLAAVVTEFRARFDRDPMILDWATGRDLVRELGDVPVFTPTAALETLDYLDRTIDIVALASREPARLNEATRVALAAVVNFADETGSSPVRVYGGRRAPDVTWLDNASSCLPSISIVIPCYDGVEHTRVCLETLGRVITPGLACEVIVVDDASSDGTQRYLRDAARDNEWLHVLRNDRNEGYLESVNRGAEAATGEILVFLNNDTISFTSWISALAGTFRRFPDAGVVGGKLLYPDGRVQEAGGMVFRDGSAAKFGAFDPALTAPLYNFVRDVDYCSGALLATPRALFEELGGFDAAYAPGYYEDTDYCFRVRAQGRRVLYQPASAIVHVEGGTAGLDVNIGMKRYQVLNHERFVARWREVLALLPERPPEPFDSLDLFELSTRRSAPAEQQ
ncbi:MAG TPA: glycosyltransferase [Acidimicrobiia bacterium]|jgi:GT2 family glycosyltransferase|nr:glycosyltransferase [Acidimicrobiia bacterium]